MCIYYQVYTKSPVFVWEIFPRILGKRPKGILKGWSKIKLKEPLRKKWLNIEAFLNYLNYFKYTEDESTKAFCSLIKDTRQMIFGDRI